MHRFFLLSCWVTFRLFVTVSTAQVYMPQPPRFSWDTLPIFFHSSNKSGPFNTKAVQLMAKFPMVTVEKFQGKCANSKSPLPTPSCREEDLIISELKKVKKVNPNVSTIFYMNSVLDFSQYTLHAMMRENPRLWLHDAQNQIVKLACPSPTRKCYLFDHSDPLTRSLFISTLINTTKSGAVDGFFLDRAGEGSPADRKDGDYTTPCSGKTNCFYNTGVSEAKLRSYFYGHIKVLSDLQSAIGEAALIGNNAWGPPHDSLATGAISFTMIENFRANNESINRLRIAGKNRRGVQAHEVYGSCDENTIAAFLIGAGYRAYFGTGDWEVDDDSQLGRHWCNCFELPLGTPLEPAVYNSTTRIWTRRFEHVHVSFNVHINRGKISGWIFPSIS